MKLKNTKWIALLAAGLAISTQSAQAATNTFAPGDLILAVQDTNVADPNHNSVFMIDLGSPTSPTGISGLGSNLAALYGAGWYTNTGLTWGIFGYTTTGSGLNLKYQPYVTAAEPVYGTQGAGFTTLSQSQMNSAGSQIKSADATAAANGTDATFTNQVGTFNSSFGIAEDASDINSYATFNPPSAVNSFGQFNPSIQANGFSGSALDLFLVGPLSSTYQGTFTMDASGNLTFSATPPSTATPEAGSAIWLMTLGLGCMVTLRRRLGAKAA